MQKVKGQGHTTLKTDLEAWSVSNSWPVHVTVSGPFFWTGRLLDNNFRVKDRAIFDGSIFNVDPWAPGHVTSCLQVMLFGCIGELKGIYNV